MTANSLRQLHGIDKDNIKRADSFSAPLDLINEEPGFNTRDYDSPEAQEHIANLAVAYANGEDLPPLKVKVVDGVIYLRDGHCRYRAALLARDNGAEIHRLPLLETKGDEVEQSLIILTSNEGLKLKPLEQAKVYARLQNFGLTPDEIATRVRKTTTSVQQYLDLDGLPVKLKKLISNGTVTFTLALQLYKKYGSKAVDMIQAKQKEGKKVTAKDVESITGYRTRLTGDTVVKVTDTLKSLVERFNDECETPHEDDGDENFDMIHLSNKEIRAIRELYESVKVKEDQ